MPSVSPVGVHDFVLPLFAAIAPEDVGDEQPASAQTRIVMFPASPSVSEYVALTKGVGPLYDDQGYGR